MKRKMCVPVDRECHHHHLAGVCGVQRTRVLHTQYDMTSKDGNGYEQLFVGASLVNMYTHCTHTRGKTDCPERLLARRARKSQAHRLVPRTVCDANVFTRTYTHTHIVRNNILYTLVHNIITLIRRYSV